MPMLWLYAFLHVAYGSPQYQDTVFLVLSLNQMSETASLPGVKRRFKIPSYCKYTAN